MTLPLLWQENGVEVSRNWISESNFSNPRKILVANDELKADVFYRMASEGAAFVWRGDFQNAKQLLQAVQRRIDKRPSKKATDTLSATESFLKHRQAQAHRAQLLSRLLICVESDLNIKLPRAPDVCAAICEALGETPTSGFVLSLRELLGQIGAYEWRKKGVLVPALDKKIHPHYGIFSPVRGEYLELIAKAPLPQPLLRAFDIGTGTGVIAALLAKRQVPEVIATDLDPRAIECARDNISRLELSNQVKILKTDLFPEGKADLVVCNPPWLPARPTSRIENAIYDENSQMLKGFLNGTSAHLTESGEAWLILSDLAELLGLRKPNELSELIKNAGLRIVEILETKPKHRKSQDPDDPLFEARAKETTRLFRLKIKDRN